MRAFSLFLDLFKSKHYKVIDRTIHAHAVSNRSDVKTKDEENVYLAVIVLYTVCIEVGTALL